MRPIIALLVVGAILLIIYVYKQLRKSLGFDKFVKDITEEANLDTPKTDGMIKEMSAAEKALQSKADSQNKEAKKLQKDSDKIGEYLSKKTGGEEANSKEDNGG